MSAKADKQCKTCGGSGVMNYYGPVEMPDGFEVPDGVNFWANVPVECPACKPTRVKPSEGDSY